MSKKYSTGYEPVSEDSDNEKGDKRKSFSNSRSVGESASPASNNCETQTFPVDDLSFQTEIMASETPIPPKTVTNWDKFRLLMWKNYLIQWRHKWRLIFEIFLPVAMILFIVYVRSTIEIKKIENPRKFRSFDIDNLPLLSNTERRLVFTPNHSIIHSIVAEASTLLSIEEPIGVSSDLELETELKNNSLLAGVAFNANITKLPQKLQYSLMFPNKLRKSYGDWRTNSLFPIQKMLGPRENNTDTGGSPSYADEGFLAIQNAIALAYIKVKAGTLPPDLPKIKMNILPYPPFLSDLFLNALGDLVPYLILLSFVCSCANIVRYIAIEKEKQLKEAMKIMGLPNWLHWTGWFVKSLIYMIIVITFMTVLLKTPMFGSEVAVIENSNAIILWLFLFVYSLSIITFSFAVSVFFSKANTSTTMAIILFMVLYQPYSLGISAYDRMSTFVKLLSCLCMNSGMSFGFNLILKLEGRGEGLYWSNFMEGVSIDDDLSVFAIILMLALAAVIHLIIALYIEQVRPGEFGVPQPWYFPFRKEFWVGISDRPLGENTILMEETSASSNVNGIEDLHNFEADPTGKRAGIKIIDFRKVYDNKKVAVNNLSMNVYEDQITVLLGHNGAGKTTTMSMITGMFPPTSGTAYVNGHDIRTHTHNARSSIGLCPQYNVLFDELTVREHIQFFSRLKGSSQEIVEEEVKKYVHAVELDDKVDALASTLSGGMKRKLSTIVALCGKSKVVLCDEPSSGMDPAARRSLWNLLEEEKKGRTILLSTHFMDEADILGDRVAIMAEGELKCCGSSFFLKKHLGTGYHLVCVKGDNCKVDDVTHILRKYIPNIKIANNIGQELSYQLPEEKISIFEEMFKDIEDHKNDLNLESFGVSLTTLEDVFLKVGSDSTAIHSREQNKSYGTVIGQDLESEIGGSDGLFDQDLKLLEGGSLMLNQSWAMFRKRFIYWKRSWIMFIVQNFIAIALVGSAIYFANEISKYISFPPLKIDLKSYRKTVTILEKPGDSLIATEYEKMLKGQTKIDVISGGLEDYFIKISEKEISYTNLHYIAAATIDKAKNTITAWFNGQPYHSAPLSLNLIHNALIRATFGKDYGIEITNKPIQMKDDSLPDFVTSGSIYTTILASTLTFAMAFVTSFYIMFHIKERVSKAKHLQFVSGVNVFIFWITSLVWDLLTYFITATLVVGIIASFRIDGLSSVTEMSRLLLILLTLGFGILPLTYLVAFIFTAPSNGYTVMSIFNFFTGFPVFLLAEVVIKKVAYKYILQILFPFYSLVKVMFGLVAYATERSYCLQICQHLGNCEACDKSFLFDTDAGRDIGFMVAGGFFYLFILFVIECRLLSGIIYIVLDKIKRKLPPEIDGQTLDSDVLEEKREVNAMTAMDLASQNLVIRQISKFYGRFLAVNQLSIAIKPAECFGLLGVNGAGKTTTFKMLTGDERISYGDGWARGINLRSSMTSVHKIIGYCPQFDALLDELTGTETLEIFGLLRGVARSEIDRLSKKLATELNFEKHLEKKVSEFSGGNKRKLSTSVALLGNPHLVYLDEPTTGMDPGAKRNVWNIVCRARNSGKSIILTSHSMEECEALCTRLAIMVNGQFKCLGSTQHLKNKFSKGYILTVKIKKPNDSNVDASLDPEFVDRLNQIKDYIEKNFKHAELREEYQGLLTYYVPPVIEMNWSRMFGIMERCKSALGIEDYSISQTSLEQVFLSFTKNQNDAISTQDQDQSIGRIQFPWSRQ